MADQPDLLDFPAGLLSSGDPSPDNPFPIEDPGYRSWEDATREAEEELHRFNSDLLKTRPDPIDAGVGWMCGLVVGKFDIWAKRGISVVWSAEAVTKFDQSLIAYSTEWLQTVRGFFPSAIHIDTLLHELRLRLIERIEWWRAEARRYVAAQKAQLASATNGETPPEYAARSWQDVRISFFNERTVEITVGESKYIREYSELGMAHARSGNPLKAWETLHSLAQRNGEISRPTGKSTTWPTVEKRMQELRAWLQERFGLSTDPLPFKKSRDGSGYVAEFKIHGAPSYRE
jgi:hypothetical protein